VAIVARVHDDCDVQVSALEDAGTVWLPPETLAKTPVFSFSPRQVLDESAEDSPFVSMNIEYLAPSSLGNKGSSPHALSVTGLW